MENNKLLNGALNLAALGLSVIPLIPGGKRPAIQGWQAKATRDEKQIREWWTENPAYNVGVATGSAFGIMVIDYDVADGKPGLTVRSDWQRTHGAQPTWTARSARGGIHEYYKLERPMTGKTGLYGCVDLRADGNLIVAPPSIFDGKEYAWECPPLLYQLAPADSMTQFFIDSAPREAENRQPYQMPEQIAEGGRTAALVKLIGALRAKGLDAETIRLAVDSENDLKNAPPLTQAELDRDVYPAITRRTWTEGTAPYTNDLAIDTALFDRVAALDPANNKRYGQNDAGAARLFIDACGANIRYAEDRRRWLSYDGRRWNVDGESAVKESLKTLADTLALYTLQNVPEEDKRSKLLSYFGKLQQLRTRETILKDAASVKPARSDDFDRNPNYLNCQNGTLDLKTLEFHQHTPADMLSRLARVEYDPAAVCPRWLQFIDEVTDGDKELASYIQKALGYALTGENVYECFFVLYGATSRNGKSTLAETFSFLMGDYAATARPETLAKKKYANGSGPSEDIARLAGVRFVNVSEPPKNMELDSALVKSMTGRDTITARRLNEGSFEYTPQFKLFMNTNYRPRVDDMSVFESERVKMIPFNVHFGTDKQDPRLKEKLRTPASLAGILNWCIEGLKLIRAEGFNVPQAVQEATAEYRRKEDKILLFLEECTETGDALETPLMELHSAFGNWCSTSGLISVSLPKFMEMLEERQIPVKRKRPVGAPRTANAVKMVLYKGLKA